MRLAIAYAATFLIFGLIDFIWLGVVAKDYYRGQIGHLMGDAINIPAAIVFYLVYIAGLMFFAVGPALSEGNWQRAALYGAAFGFFAYATYDLTNLATLRDWPLGLSMADMAWGTFLSGVSATLGYAIASRVGA